jgi:hypothetical protein
VNDDSKQLVEAAGVVLDEFVGPDLTGRAVAAVLRRLAGLMAAEDMDSEWPDSGDLELLADDIEGGGE